MAIQPIRSQVSKLTQLLTMTTTHKFPLQADNLRVLEGEMEGRRVQSEYLTGERAAIQKHEDNLRYEL